MHAKRRTRDARWLESYILDQSTFRRLGERWGISGAGAWKRVQRTQHQEIDMGILVGFRFPKEVRVLMLDGKHLRIKGKPYTLYLAFDAERMRPLCWILLPRYELRAGYDRMLGYLKRKNVAIPSVVSDAGKGLIASLKDYYPGAVHQHCAFHVLMQVRLRSGGERVLASKEGRAYWKKVSQVGCKDPDLVTARRHLAAALRKYPEKKTALLFLRRHLKAIYQFPKYGPLKDHRTSNRIENAMGQVEARAKTMRGMKTPKTAARMIASILKEKYKKTNQSS